MPIHFYTLSPWPETFTTTHILTAKHITHILHWLLDTLTYCLAIIIIPKYSTYCATSSTARHFTFQHIFPNTYLHATLTARSSTYCCYITYCWTHIHCWTYFWHYCFTVILILPFYFILHYIVIYPPIPWLFRDSSYSLNPYHMVHCVCPLNHVTCLPGWTVYSSMMLKGCTELRQNYTVIFKIIKISTQNYTISKSLLAQDLFCSGLLGSMTISKLSK